MRILLLSIVAILALVPAACTTDAPPPPSLLTPTAPTTLSPTAAVPTAAAPTAVPTIIPTPPMLTPTPSLSPREHAKDTATATPTPSPTIRSTRYRPTPNPTRETAVTVIAEYIYVCGPASWVLIPDKQQLHFLHWTGNGSHLIFDFGENIWSVDIDSGELYKVVDVNPDDEDNRRKWKMAYNFYASPSPDGSEIAYTTCQYDEIGSVSPEDAGPRIKLGYELATIAIDGTDQERLTGNPYFDHFPTWSPDGEKIAYLTNTGSRFRRFEYDPVKTGIGIMDTNPVRSGGGMKIEQDWVALYPPVWSPDSQRLAFAVLGSGYPPHWHDIYTVRADGDEVQRIGVGSELPTWSPDGQQLAFAKSTDVNSVLYTARYDGTYLKQIWPGKEEEQLEVIKRVNWSPDGSEILVVSQLSTGASRLWTISPDGSEIRTVGLSEYSLQLVDAIWSPDGSRIAVRASFDWVEPRVYSDDEDLTIMTLSRDGSDPQVMVATHPPAGFYSGDPRGLYPVKPPSGLAPMEPVDCSEGLVVLEPESNQGLVRDCETLLTARDRLAGRASLNWSTETSILEWEGVEIEGTPPRVKALNLGDKGLTGTIPPEIGLLSELAELSLYGSPAYTPNFLTGSIPSELGNLGKLEYLSLTGNLLSGSIPEELGQLENLQRLGIGNNFLTGCIPKSLTDLERHDFEDTGLEFCSEVEAAGQ